MQVSVEKLEGLERSLTIEVPVEQIEDECAKRLKNLSSRVKIDGFRPGKVPAHVIKQRYGDSVHQEVIGEIMQQNFYKAVVEKELKPAGPPTLDLVSSDQGKPLTFKAKFEVYPDVELKPFDKLKIEKTTSELTDADLDKTLDAIRNQHAEWVAVDRAAKDADQVKIDFKGVLDGEPLPGGDAEDFDLIIGSNSMIPGFEDGMLKHKAGDTFKIKPKFPDDYHAKELAGKTVEFTITLKAVNEPKLPELDEAFAKKLGVEGGIEKLREEIKQNMQRELDNAIKTQSKLSVMDALFEANKIDVPTALIDGEIKQMQEQMAKQYGGQVDINMLMDKSSGEMEEQAKRRVSLGLLLAEIVKKDDMKPDTDKVKAEIEKMAAAYEKPEEVVSWYYGDKQRLGQVEAMVLEEQVIDKILADAKVKEISKKFDDIINRKAQ
tara:strand:- start:230940 stop:232244 length:1305 start_codon:yes stop_codon:yes gene_type:complete